jgi:hypothetical protein
MPRVPLILTSLALAGLLPVGAAAFNPEPRPAPGGVTTVCADDTSIRCCAAEFGCDDPAEVPAADCASHTCTGDPADLASTVAVRGTLTFISDEDVTGWDDGADGSTDRPSNARLTVLLQYERDGALRTFAEIYKLGNVCAFDTELDPGVPFLCVPEGLGWSQPATEDVITDPQFNIVFSSPGDQVSAAIAADLTGNPSTTLRPYLDIVDRLPATASNHASDPLASVQQLKVTIRLFQP